MELRQDRQQTPRSRGAVISIALQSCRNGAPTRQGFRRSRVPSQYFWSCQKICGRAVDKPIGQPIANGKPSFYTHLLDHPAPCGPGFFFLRLRLPFLRPPRVPSPTREYAAPLRRAPAARPFQGRTLARLAIPRPAPATIVSASSASTVWATASALWPPLRFAGSSPPAARRRS